MKKFILFFLCTVLSALPLSAQMTARQVLEKTMDVLNKEKGYSADLQIKAMGLKFQIALAVRGQQSVFKTDEGDMYVNGTTTYAYDKKKNTVTIATRKKEEKMQMDMSSTFSTGYDLTIEKAKDAYVLRFKKQKGNKTKDAPSSAEMTVNTQNFYPKTIHVKSGIISTTITYSNIKTNIPAQLVAYNAQKYPGATIVDKR